MNAKQRRDARRNGTPSIPPLLLMAVAARENAFKAQVRTQVQAMQDSMDDLRLAMQYLVFDNECLRRENAALRSQLGA